MDATTIQAMIAEDREEWAKLVAMLDAHPEGPLHDPESPEWTARDVYTHIARLREGSARHKQDKVDGKQVKDMYAGADENEVNACVQQKYGNMTFDEARAWARKAFDGLIAAIEAVPLDEWDGELESYARADGADHYRGHRSYISPVHYA